MNKEGESAVVDGISTDENPSSKNCITGNDPEMYGIQRATDLLVAVSANAEVQKAKIKKLAFAASEELVIMAEEREPLWVLDAEKGCEFLNEEEYNRRFASLDPTLEEIIRVIASGGPSDLNADVNVFQNDCAELKFDASRANGLVFRDPISLVEMFMDVDKWSGVFYNIVSNAVNLGVLSPGNNENLNGQMQVMVAEFQVPSPRIKTQEMYFVRYSTQVDPITWVVVDVSLENVFPNPVGTCQRKPSGCIMQALQDGLSKVTWVEHTAVYGGLVHDMFKPLFSSGLAFNANRWISSLERQTDRMATIEAQNEPPHSSINIESYAGFESSRNGLLKLAERMVRRFSSNIRADSESMWMPLPVSGSEEILVKTSCNQDNPGISGGIAVTIATSVWLPFQQADVFNFLRNEHNRGKWDILSSELEIRDIIRVSSPRKSSDYVSVVSAQFPMGRTVITYLQESYNDSTASYVVYGPVDIPSMNHVLEGGCVDSVAILPSGFAVLPTVGSLSEQNHLSGTRINTSSILTIAFELMDEELTTTEYLPPQSIYTAHRLMKETVSRIETALLLQNL